MTQFNNYSNILPDGVNTVSTAGAQGGALLEVRVEGRNNTASAGNAGTAIITTARYSQTSASGVGASFTATTASGATAATTVVITSEGRGYKPGDTFVVPSSSLPNTAGSTIVIVVVRVAEEGDITAGFKSISVNSKAPIMKSRTNSGKLVTRYAAYHQFDFSIGYHKLLKSQFMPIYAFLLEKQGSLKPFFVELPQYQGNNGDLLIASTAAAGATSIEAKIASATTEFGTEPSLGDLFTITDPDNSNHTKAYIVNRIETYETYRGTQPSLGEIRIHFTPTLNASVGTSSILNFSRPLVKVINKSDKQSYSLDTDNLYSLKLSLEEATN